MLHEEKTDSFMDFKFRTLKSFYLNFIFERLEELLLEGAVTKKIILENSLKVNFIVMTTKMIKEEKIWSTFPKVN